MAIETDIPASLIKQLVLVNPSTGDLYWAQRNKAYFQTDDEFYSWNKEFGLKQIKTRKIAKGYLMMQFFGETLFAHRVVWAAFHGEWPKGQIDHIDGCKTNNSIDNIRVVSNTENARNRKRPNRNTSGHVGVYFHKSRSKWCAQIIVDGRKIGLGSFDTIDLAVAARANANLKYGFHPNHGR